MKDAYLLWLAETLPGFLNGGTNNEIEDLDDDCKDPDVTVAVTSTSWDIAKVPPFRNLTIDQLSSQFGADDFVIALSIYLHEAMPTSSIQLNMLDQFNAYRQVILTLPSNCYLSNQKRTNCIRTTPAIQAQGHKHETVGQFDIALVIEDKIAYQASVGFAGMFDLSCLMLNEG